MTIAVDMGRKATKQTNTYIAGYNIQTVTHIMLVIIYKLSHIHCWL